MLYRNSTIPVNVTTIRGISLARRPMSSAERAFLGADLYLGNLTIVDPTIKQAATVAGSNSLYVRHALRADPGDRWAIIGGFKPLISPSNQALERVIRAAGVEASWAVIEKLLV